MQLPPAADSHDAIAAQLRILATRPAHDPSGSKDTPATSPEPASEPSLRVVPFNDNTSDIRIPTPHARSGRGVILLAVCAGVAATMAWHSYGDEAKQRFSHLVSQLHADAPAPTQSANATEPQGVTSQIAAPQPAVAQTPAQDSSNAASATQTPAPTPATPAAEAPPTQVTLPPELTQSLETMAREIASLKQTVEQLRAGQQQLSNDVAKAGENQARHKLAEQPSKPTSRQRLRHTSTPAAASRTVVPYSPPSAHSQRQTYPQGITQREAYVPPPAPTQLPPPPGDSSVPRPPMPLQ
jgi:hypothetical protein